LRSFQLKKIYLRKYVNYEENEKLGEGSYGEVFKVKNKHQEKNNLMQSKRLNLKMKKWKRF
jgi:serine/threonine protein kinase